MKHVVLVISLSVLCHFSFSQIISVNDDIQLVHLEDSVFIHVSWHTDAEYGRYPSNGLILIREGKALMVDTPVDNEKTESLVKGLKNLFSAEVELFIPGHFHEDCLGGLDYLNSIGVKSLANSLTVAKCNELQLPVPSESFSDFVVFDFHGEKVECRYFGPGHSVDNITVWLPQRKILFGGCLVKSIHSRGLGNLSDAMVEEWDTTVNKLAGTYGEIKTVIPGHGEAGGAELLDHTIRLVERHKAGY